MKVRAKRLGWDQANGAVSARDDFDPPAWMDDGLDEWIEGELKEEEIPADDMYQARKVFTINGQLIDPRTIERADHPFPWTYKRPGHR